MDRLRSTFWKREENRKKSRNKIGISRNFIGKSRNFRQKSRNKVGKSGNFIGKVGIKRKERSAKPTSLP